MEIDWKINISPFPSIKNGWLADDGWVKMSQNVNGVEIHYIKNTITNEFVDFKFKWWKIYGI